MSGTTNLNIRIDKDLKESGEALFAELGMTFTTAIHIFVRQSLRERKIPFEIKLMPPAFGESGEANLADFMESVKQINEGRVVSFNSVEDLIAFTERRADEDPVF